MMRSSMSGLFGILLGALILGGAYWGAREAQAQIQHDSTPHTLATKCCDRN